MQRYSHPDPLAEVAEVGEVGRARDPRRSRALIVGSDPLVRDGFVARLETTAAGDIDTDADVPAAVRSLDVNVVLWDLGPGLVDPDVSFSGLDVPVVALSSPGTRASDVLSRGAAGVLLRDASTDALHAAFETVRVGLSVVEPSLLGEDLDTDERDAPPAAEDLSNIDPPTPRERQVLNLMALGLSNKEIATRLGISTHTAKFHIGALLAKLDATTRTEAVVRAVQRGLVLV